MRTVLRWLTGVVTALAALCVALVAWSLAERAYYQAAAHALSSSVRAEGPVRTDAGTAPAGVESDVADSTDAAVIRPPAVTTGAWLAADLIGELDVPHLKIAAAVVEGSNGTALRRGAGHLRGTAMPGDAGNVVLAGHRDTVFRRLGDLRRGDRLRFTTARGVFHYRVTGTLLVRPEDTWVLHPRAAALTLITCYPFDWIGSAPERWVVQAEPIGADGVRVAER